MHYKNGTEAKVGDLVKGTTYNTPKGSVQVGILLGITPGTTACNARVLIPVQRDLGRHVLPYPTAEDNGKHPHALGLQTQDGWFTVHREGYGQEDHPVLVGHKVDYTACGDLELVHRPEA